MRIRLEACDLPGRTFGEHTAVHVGLQRGKEPFELVPAASPSATWTFEVATKPGPDWGGPFVQGRKGDRFFYLTWGDVVAGHFHMFRRLKLRFAAMPVGVESVVGRISLTDEKGGPRCGSAHPPTIGWTAE
jgi:hypothetical protein